jgi:hypothetical protein
LLRFTTVGGYALAVKGSGWQPRARVLFWIRAGAMAEGRELATTATGTFVVGINGLNMCAAPVFRARDFGAGRAKLRGPALGCPVPLVVHPPQLRIVVGTAAPHSVVKINGREPQRVTMHVGDELYLWEQGTGAASFVPHADSHYLVLIRMGTTPARMCPQANCAGGFYWDYAAVKAGTTGVDLSARCRLVTPPCEIPDFLIQVVILP